MKIKSARTMEKLLTEIDHDEKRRGKKSQF